MTIIKTFDTEEVQKRFPKKYLSLMAVTLIVLALIEIWANNTVITYDDKFSKLATIEKNLKMENQIFENEIAKNSSLGEIATESAKLGFYQHQSIQYIR